MSPEQSLCARDALRSPRLENRRPLDLRSVPSSDRGSGRTFRLAHLYNRIGMPAAPCPALFFPASVVARERTEIRNTKGRTRQRQWLRIYRTCVPRSSYSAVTVPKLTANKSG